ncbi:DUF6894 family protein [Croceibacterium ferulae]|uniref:DUF6894 family protein n=1 Tax=Croceibacterium ferulae TaxID=1854641 RepID=UPI000F89425C
MQRYYTDVRSATYSARDAEGQLFTDLGEALDFVRKDGRQMISAVLAGGEDAPEIEFRIYDELRNHTATMYMVAKLEATVHLEMPDSSQGG